MSTVNTSTLKVGDYFHFEGWPQVLYVMTDVTDEGFSCDRIDPPENSCTGYRLLKHTEVLLISDETPEEFAQHLAGGEPNKRPTDLVPCVLGECRVGERVWGQAGNAYEVRYVGSEVVVLGTALVESSCARNGLFQREPRREWVPVTADTALQQGDRVLSGTETATVVTAEGQQVVARWDKPAADYPLTILNRARIAVEVLS